MNKKISMPVGGYEITPDDRIIYVLYMDGIRIPEPSDYTVWGIDDFGNFLHGAGWYINREMREGVTIIDRPPQIEIDHYYSLWDKLDNNE